MMNFPETPIYRLSNQQIANTEFQTAKELVNWMGAMQAQDYQMAKWAIGLRLPHTTDQLIESAFNRGEILRTHLMRPTWHFVSADDIHWMLKLTAPQIKSQTKARQKELELTEDKLPALYTILEKALTEKEFMTRDEISEILQQNGISMNSSRSYHLMLQAELDGLICSGIVKGKEQTYALLDRRVPNHKSITKEEALAELGKRYFSSHGPATIPDFAWWSGLSLSMAKRVVEMNKPSLSSELSDGNTYWFATDQSAPLIQESVFLLPAFDEYLISYRNRSAVITDKNHQRAISFNGVFRPVIVTNGLISGLWKRTVKKDKILLETNLFREHDSRELLQIKHAAESFGIFLEKEIVFKTT